MPELVELKDVTKHFPVRGGVFQRSTSVVHALDGVSLSVVEGETLGVVGESGCGKSTLARCVAGLVQPTSGEVRVEGRAISKLRGRELRDARRNMQIVFQDPYASLNPRMAIGDIISAPLRIHHVGSRQWRRQRVHELLGLVGLSVDYEVRLPHELSGGQRQRVGIARALALQPKLIIADEPVSALDVSIKAQILNLMVELQQELNLTYLFISHDLGIMRYICDRIAVMYLGRVMEIGTAEDVYKFPVHPYTSALLAAVPVPDPIETRKRAHDIPAGDVPSPIAVPSGCRFHTRCPRADEVCGVIEPEMTRFARGTQAACHHPIAGPVPGAAQGLAVMEGLGPDKAVPSEDEGLADTHAAMEPTSARSERDDRGWQRSCE